MKELPIADFRIPPLPVIQSFSLNNGLTPREQEIIVCFLKAHVTNEEIGKTLGLSPFTVSNHVKSILQKTKTGSKAEVLAIFIRHMTIQQKDWQLFIKRPRVLVVDDEEDICLILKEDLENRGFNVYTETDSSKVPELIQNLQLDIIVSDILMPGMSGLDLLRVVQDTDQVMPVIIFITGCTNYDEAELMSMGAAGFVSKPIDFQELHFRILENFIEDPYTLNRFRRVTSHIEIDTFDFKCHVKNIGFGGVFISAPPKSIQSEPRIKEGAILDISFRLDDSEDQEPISCSVNIQWVRAKDQQHLSSGFGARFLNISLEDQNRVRRYVRTKKSISFIPLGLKSPPVEATARFN